MVAEVLDVLQPAPGRVYLDGTLGGGGHTTALLERGARVVALDADPAALLRAESLQAAHGPALRTIHGNFSRAASLPGVAECSPYDGVLLDLGVSSHQLDTASRGFSFRADGPLDMRMDPTSGGPTAADLVNSASQAELTRLFRELGEEPQASRMAAAIVRARMQAPFRTTIQLAEVIEGVCGRRGRLHPATKVFQALRLAVNGELTALRQGLEGCTGLLRRGGRFAVITFHSLEDRLVKGFFRERSRPSIDRPEWPEPRPNPLWMFRDLTRRPLEPGVDEVRANPRARSARLRAVELLPEVRA